MKVLSYNPSEDRFFVGLSELEFKQVKEIYSHCTNDIGKEMFVIRQYDIRDAYRYTDEPEESMNYINMIKEAYEIDNLPFICVIVDRNLVHIETSVHHHPFHNLWNGYSP